MESILLTIKNEYVHLIRIGLKLYELRKVRPKKDIKRVFIFEKGKGIVGYFDTKIAIVEKGFFYDRHSEEIGISQGLYYHYLINYPNVVVYAIFNPVFFDKPKKIEGLKAPQGFKYLSDNDINEIMK